MSREEFIHFVDKAKHLYTKYIEFADAAAIIGFHAQNNLFDDMIDMICEIMNKQFPDLPMIIEGYVYEYVPEYIEDNDPEMKEKLIDIIGNERADELYDLISEQMKE